MTGEGRIRIKVMGPMFGAFTKSTCVDRCEFVYDAACDDYDWLVVFDELPVKFEPSRQAEERFVRLRGFSVLLQMAWSSSNSSSFVYCSVGLMSTTKWHLSGITL